MKKTLKIILAISVLLFIALCIIFSQRPKHDEEETELFSKYRADFELVNNYVLENFDTDSGERNIGVVKSPIVISGLYENGDIRIDKEIRNALNSLDECFKSYDFSFIEITDERVSYGGLGYRMYVYSRNGKVHDYYFHKGDGMRPEVYNLCDNWYLLKVNFI